MTNMSRAEYHSLKARYLYVAGASTMVRRMHLSGSTSKSFCNRYLPEQALDKHIYFAARREPGAKIRYAFRMTYTGMSDVNVCMLQIRTCVYWCHCNQYLTYLLYRNIVCSCPCVRKNTNYLMVELAIVMERTLNVSSHEGWLNGYSSPTICLGYLYQFHDKVFSACITEATFPYYL